MPCAKSRTPQGVPEIVAFICNPDLTAASFAPAAARRNRGSQPVGDAQKREDEHRALSETILHHVILKLDGVEPDGDEVVRARRKGLVKEMQGVLGALDAAKEACDKA